MDQLINGDQALAAGASMTVNAFVETFNGFQLLGRFADGSGRDLAAVRAALAFFYLTHAPESTSPLKQAVIPGGPLLEGHVMRSWVGWHRHVTLARLALTYIAAVRRSAAKEV